MLSVTTPLMSNARQPASQAPPRTRLQLRAFEPFDVADRAQRGDHHVHVEHGSIGKAGRPDVSFRVALEAFYGHAGPQVDSGFQLHLCRDIADHAAKRTDQWRLATLGHRHREIEIPAHRIDLRPDKTRADDEHPAWPPFQGRGQLLGVIASAHREQTLERSLLRVEPGARPGSGSDQQPVVLHPFTVGQQHLAGGPVQTHRRHAQPPLRVNRTQPGQLRVVCRHPTLEHLLGQRRPVVGFVLLVSDDSEMPRKTPVPQCFRSAQASQRSAHDDHASLGFEGVDELADQRPRVHLVSRSAGGSTSRMIACTGHDAAARNTRCRWESSGLGSYASASSPTSLNTSGASGTHWA